MLWKLQSSRDIVSFSKLGLIVLPAAVQRVFSVDTLVAVI